MIVNLTKNEIKHLVYLLGRGDADYPELNANLLKKLEPLTDTCICKEKDNMIKYWKERHINYLKFTDLLKQAKIIS